MHRRHPHLATGRPALRHVRGGHRGPRRSSSAEPATTLPPVSDDPVLRRMLDRLEINPPYDGIVADGYDSWLPFDGPMGDEELYDELLDGIDGPVLELGCGTGRLLLRWLKQGRSVEGVDSAVDMLAKLRRHAAEVGVDPTVHV